MLYVALLRGINVGGKTKVPMAALRDTCASVGCEDVVTYIQSGNVVLRSTLRADDFVASVRQQRVPDPSSANVRVMTIHAAKGLQFDAVVLPELDASLTGRAPAFVVARDPASLNVSFVCRYANESVQKLLSPNEQLAFEHDRKQRVEESLSLLYVAMTRAVYGLYLFVPGPRRRVESDAWM